LDRLRGEDRIGRNACGQYHREPSQKRDWVSFHVLA
jgi:hypothetical protein